MLKKLWVILAAIFLILQFFPISIPAKATTECPLLRFVFARGSGAERWEDKNYKTFKGWITPKLSIDEWGEKDYEFIDLDYPAIGMDINNFWAVLGAYFGMGDSYEFGRSVDAGVDNLLTMINGSCPETKYVLGGYSQGAMVVSKAIHSISPDRIIYAATFGDPKLYLPEGKGLFPSACRGENLSDYRAYVPDCHAFEGMLGSYRPYQPIGYEGKLGTWCNKMDIFCSSYLSLNDHLNYADGKNTYNLYRDASRMIAAKVNAAFDIKDRFVSEHDTAILIDSTASMNALAEKYRSEALRLAKETLDNGGRVALYDFRDYGEWYTPSKGCDFYNCTMEKFTKKLDEIVFEDGGDLNESLLGSSFAVMQELDWKYGSTKNLVILTDAGYHEPDLDLNHTTFDDVVKLSKQIDPVHINIVTTADLVLKYQKLADATDGKVADIDQNLSLLTDEIMSSSDALPRVEEEFDDEIYENDLPDLNIIGTEDIGDGIKIKFKNTGTKAIVVVNDLPVGLTDGEEITLNGMDKTTDNRVALVPISNTRRGNPVAMEFPAKYRVENSMNLNNHTTTDRNYILVPKVPNTGRR